MAVIAKTNMTSNAAVTVTSTTMTASDTFVYDPSRRAFLELRNTTGGPLSPVIVGSTNAPVFVNGYGNAPVAGGYTAIGAIPATTGRVCIELAAISQWLNGTITVTGGTGLTATIFEFA
jgi:hypothetical protein